MLCIVYHEPQPYQYVINERNHKYLNARLELLERPNRSIDTL